MPQEIEVWYVLPSLRRALAHAMLREGLAQKKIAQILGITEAAVSQYIKKKRGAEITFSKKEKEAISHTARAMIRQPTTSMEHLYKLCNRFKGAPCICALHHKHDPTLAKNCSLCRQ
jgi:predicted transcriptional regulator